MSGYIKLHRTFFEHPFWKETRTYSKAEAWLDLIRMARFEASTEIINNKSIEFQRGDIPISRRFLELRWNWGSTKVMNFIKMLEKMEMTNQRQTNGQTILTLVNYGIYNDMQTGDKPKTKPTTNQRQTNGKPNIRIKEYKELNNINIVIPEFDLFKSFALVNKPNVDLDALKLKYDSWVLNGWKDGNGKEIKIWKSKLLNTLPYIKEKEIRKRTNLYYNKEDQLFDNKL